MFEAIQDLVSSNKLEYEFGMDNVTVVNGKGKITRLCDDYMVKIFSLSIIILHVCYMTFWTLAMGLK